MKFAYYNEFDPKAAVWIKQLIKNGLIADGEVDERSITEVTADEIRGFTQHHFFAGIGGWSYSLRLAGWADDRPVCTASLPCQPFSVAGAQKGVDDERHLLPHFIELVKSCHFPTIFGEQVPGAIKHGWLDDLCTEMEREKYRVGQIVLTAAGSGAPHIRQRLYWVADSINKGSQGRLSGGQDQEREIISRYAGCSGTVGRVDEFKAGRETKCLRDQVPIMTGWATTQARDWKGAQGRAYKGQSMDLPAQANLREQVHPELYPNGLTQTGYIAETKSTGQLNPALSRWLMGFPEEWDIAAIQASRLMPTTRKKRESCV
jgi:site-specific DNA-cytosine methylase